MNTPIPSSKASYPIIDKYAKNEDSQKNISQKKPVLNKIAQENISSKNLKNTEQNNPILSSKAPYPIIDKYTKNENSQKNISQKKPVLSKIAQENISSKNLKNTEQNNPILSSKAYYPIIDKYAKNENSQKNISQKKSIQNKVDIEQIPLQNLKNAKQSISTKKPSVQTSNELNNIKNIDFRLQSEINASKNNISQDKNIIADKKDITTKNDDPTKKPSFFRSVIEVLEIVGRFIMPVTHLISIAIRTIKIITSLKQGEQINWKREGLRIISDIAGVFFPPIGAIGNASLNTWFNESQILGGLNKFVDKNTDVQSGLRSLGFRTRQIFERARSSISDEIKSLELKNTSEDQSIYHRTPDTVMV